MFRRAFEKPLGYAGDFRLMEMYYANEYTAETLYGDFLQHVAQHYPLGQSVRAREATIRILISSVMSNKMLSRIVSLACGPAVELQRLLRDLGPLQTPLELVLVDQDDQTMHYCHEALSRAVVQRNQDPHPMVELNCLHLSIRQILRPENDAEKLFIERAFAASDLMYATGLLDYLPQNLARRLVARLYDLLAPGGRLFLGNLKKCPTSSWIMDYVLAWYLDYRTPATMLDLAEGLDPEPAEKGIAYDETGLCMFLDITKPESG